MELDLSDVLVAAGILVVVGTKVDPSNGQLSALEDLGLVILRLHLEQRLSS